MRKILAILLLASMPAVAQDRDFESSLPSDDDDSFAELLGEIRDLRNQANALEARADRLEAALGRAEQMTRGNEFDIDRLRGRQRAVVKEVMREDFVDRLVDVSGEDPVIVGDTVKPLVLRLDPDPNIDGDNDQVYWGPIGDVDYRVAVVSTNDGGVLGASSTDGVLRTDSTINYVSTLGTNSYVTISVDTNAVNTDDQQIELFVLTSNILTLTIEDGGTTNVDLTAVVTNTDDQQIEEFTFVSNILTLTIEDGGTSNVNLTPFVTNTDDQAIQDFSITSNILTLTIEDGGSSNVNLTPYLDNTDDQAITNFSVVSNLLYIGLEDWGQTNTDLSAFIDNITFTNWLDVDGFGLTLTGGNRSGSNTITMVADSGFTSAVQNAQSDELVSVASGETAGYVGAYSTNGVIRTDDSMLYSTPASDYVQIGVSTNWVTNTVVNYTYLTNTLGDTYATGSGLPTGTGQGQILYWDTTSNDWLVTAAPASPAILCFSTASGVHWVQLTNDYQGIYRNTSGEPVSDYLRAH